MSIIPEPSTERQHNHFRALPAHILERLHAEGVDDLADWMRLGRRRFQIFGITHRIAQLLDAAAREARS